MRFTGWTGTDGLSITTGSSAEEITFLMPNHAVSISANYEEEIIPPVPQTDDNTLPPQTGDNTPIVLLTSLCVLSLAGISVLTLRRRKVR